MVTETRPVPKIRKLFPLTEEMVRAIERYRHARELRTETAAILELMQIGLDNSHKGFEAARHRARRTA